MKAIIAIALSVVLPFLGLSGVATAQSAYVGAPATVRLAASGNQLVATAPNVTSPIVALAPPAANVGTPVPIWGTGLGTVLVAGLLYLIVHGPDGHYYRYPYYGGYYRYYYSPRYVQYTGFYPASAPLITVAVPILGVVLGTVIVGGTPYLVSRDPADHIYRYPYWGPYHQFYYRPAYRPYAGANARTYTKAEVRRGNPYWNGSAPAQSNVPQHQPQSGGTNPPSGTGTHQPQSGGTNPPSGTGTHQPQSGGTNPPSGTGTHQPQSGGTNPPSGTGTHQPQSGGTNPPSGTGTHQPQSGGTNPPKGTGTHQPQSGGTNPPSGTGTHQPQSGGTNPPSGTGTHQPQSGGTNPPSGTGTHQPQSGGTNKPTGKSPQCGGKGQQPCPNQSGGGHTVSGTSK